MSGYQVPRGLLITGDDDGDRMYLEQQRLRRYFPAFRMVQEKGAKRLSAVGVLQTNLGTRYATKIVLSRKYPHELPKVVPVNWSPGSAPHQLLGGLCIMKSEQWKSFYSISLVVGKTALWLNKYEVWKAEGSWPGNQQHHGFRGLLQDIFGS